MNRAPSALLGTCRVGIHVKRKLRANAATIAIVGDLHLKPGLMQPFADAKDHIEAVWASQGDDEQPFLVQLGDLGTGQTSGSVVAFQTAKTYLDGFSAPYALVTGNHDLEGFDFETDADNLAAWEREMGQRHYWMRDMGPCLFVGLSTTRYRSNVLSHHEVHIDDDQLAWLEHVLAHEAPGKPVVVFTHAPPMGCGLKVINNLHVKNRCAWLNHSVNPHAFMDLVSKHPRVRLWFSGHFHLSQNYADSISIAAGCVFVQTGVIGEHSNRDGFRQSRLLRVSDAGFEILTIDHEDGGALRLDMRSPWDWVDAPEKLIPADEVICDPAAGYVCARDACSILWHDNIRWFATGGNLLLAQQDGMLIEYDVQTLAPTGCLTLTLGDAAVVLRDGAGTDVTADIPGDGSGVCSIELWSPGGELQQTFERNQWGSFFTVYQPNGRWYKKREALLAGLTAERDTIMT